MAREAHSERQERWLYLLMFALLGGIAAAGIIRDGLSAVFTGLWELQAHPARLINDFSVVAGPGAALLNASLVALVGLLLVWLNEIRLSGPTVAAVLTMFGFGLFGKTPVNILPILLIFVWY